MGYRDGMQIYHTEEVFVKDDTVVVGFSFFVAVFFVSGGIGFIIIIVTIGEELARVLKLNPLLNCSQVIAKME